MRFTFLLSGLILAGSVWAQEMKTGFYLVEGDKDCKKKFGPVMFVNSENMPSSDNCKFTFQNNDIRSVGICTRILSHRGDARKNPANTIAAFDSALNQGYPGFELDVWLSKDKKAMVSHDNNLRAATDCKGKIGEKTAEEIQRDCIAKRSSVIPEKRLFSKKSENHATIPTLKEVLEKYKSDPRAEQIIVDIKPIPGGRDLIEAFKEAFPQGTPDELKALQKRITFISQAPTDVLLIKEAFPDSHVALESNKTVSGLIDTPDADLWNDECGYDTLSVSFNSLYDFRLQLIKFLLGQNIQPQKKFKKLYKNNEQSTNSKRILGWTINNKHGVKGLQKYDIDDALTDMPYAKVMEILIKNTPEEILLQNLKAINEGRAEACE